MRKLPILLALLFLAFNVINIFAQKKAKLREVIVIEISVPNFENAYKIEILINRTAKTKYEEIGGGGQGKGIANGYGCGGCSPEELAKLKEQTLVENKETAKINSENPFYMFTARAFRMGKDKSNLSFEISNGKDCKSRKIFKIYRHQQDKIQLQCGISLVAYYGIESREEN